VETEDFVTVTKRAASSYTARYGSAFSQALDSLRKLTVHENPRKFFNGTKHAVSANGVCGIREGISIVVG
jgi:hypothetical protein